MIKRGISLRNPQSSSFTKACTFGTTVGMSTASRREVHRRPRLGRRTWKLADNLNPTDIRVYAGCFSVLTLERSARSWSGESADLGGKPRTDEIRRSFVDETIARLSSLTVEDV